MNLLSMILDAQNSPVLKQLASSFGISEGEATNAVSEMVPALTRGMQNNLSRQNGTEALLGALSKGNHQQYVEKPDTLSGQTVSQDGNAILGHLLGSKDVSRRVANHAATKTGLDSGLLKKMLPVIAAMVMGSVSKQATSQGLSGSQENASGATSLLTQFLDADKDGSVLDDLMGMAGKFL